MKSVNILEQEKEWIIEKNHIEANYLRKLKDCSHQQQDFISCQVSSLSY